MTPRRPGSMWALVIAVGALAVVLSAPVLDNPRLTALVLGGLVVVIGATGAIVAAIRESGARRDADERPLTDRLS